MQNGAIIYKCENPMNGYCSNSMKSQNELPNVENEIKTQNPQWVLSNVHKNGKNDPKIWKTARGGIHGSLEHEKNGGGENGEDEVAAFLFMQT